MYNFIQKTVIPDLSKNDWWKDLDPNVQAALIDAHYNVGMTKFNASKKLFNHLKNRSSLQDIISEMD